jgi:hypothetical protein
VEWFLRFIQLVSGIRRKRSDEPVTCGGDGWGGSVGAPRLPSVSVAETRTEFARTEVQGTRAKTAQRIGIPGWLVEPGPPSPVPAFGRQTNPIIQLHVSARPQLTNARPAASPAARHWSIVYDKMRCPKPGPSVCRLKIVCNTLVRHVADVGGAAVLPLFVKFRRI